MLDIHSNVWKNICVSQTQDLAEARLTVAKPNAAERELFRRLTRHLAEGHSVEAISREMDYPLSFIEKLLLRPEFQAFFEREDPESFKLWTKAREVDESEEIVQALAKGNAVRNYKALQALADGEDLRPEAKANVLRDLLKMSGTIHEDSSVEVVKISTQHLAALKSAAKELG